MLFAMRSEDPKLVSWMIVLITAVQLGVVVVLTTLQFGEADLMKPWHRNVVYAHIAVLMLLLVAVVLLVVQRNDQLPRPRPPVAAVMYAQTHKGTM